MSTIIKPMLRTFSFAHLEPDADYGALGLTVYPLGPQAGEVAWLDAMAERGREEGIEDSRRIIEQNPLLLPPLSEVFGQKAVQLTKQAALFGERVSPDLTEKCHDATLTMIKEMYSGQLVEKKFISVFQDVWNPRVMMAMKRSPDIQRRAMDTVLWSSLYECAVEGDDMLSDEQREVLISERGQLGDRVASLIDVVRAPINENTDIDELFISMATLGMQHYWTLGLVRQDRITRMFDAFAWYSSARNLDMRYCAAIAFSRTANVLHGRIDKFSKSVRTLVATMRMLRQYGCAGAERDDLMVKLIQQVMPLMHRFSRNDALIVSKELRDINGGEFSEAVVSQTNDASRELSQSRSRYGMVSKSL